MYVVVGGGGELEFQEEAFEPNQQEKDSCNNSHHWIALRQEGDLSDHWTVSFTATLFLCFVVEIVTKRFHSAEMKMLAIRNITTATLRNWPSQNTICGTCSRDQNENSTRGISV